MRTVGQPLRKGSLRHALDRESLRIRLLAGATVGILVCMVTIVLWSGPASSPQVFERRELDWLGLRDLLLQYHDPLLAVVALDQLFALLYTATFMALASSLRRYDDGGLIALASVIVGLAGGLADVLENSMHYSLLETAENSISGPLVPMAVLDLVTQLKFLLVHFAVLLLGLLVPCTRSKLAMLLWISLLFVQAPLGVAAMWFEKDGPVSKARVAFMLFAFSALSCCARELFPASKHKEE
mmetsp:Transcript_8187/g.34394  ORF Transcript_8187/g.34394 Transcript_8187/m.34394 type:complete len:241 (+) Transcript_8187:62-784(+)